LLRTVFLCSNLLSARVGLETQFLAQTGKLMLL
jgi:hypothetical protein